MSTDESRTDQYVVPTSLRPALLHGLVQRIADDQGIDLLHIKGPAVNESLLAVDAEGNPVPRGSSDADVLVRPKDAKRLVTCLVDAGLRRRAGFISGSPFEHAASLWSDALGWIDVHRYFPGVTLKPARAFELWWQTREPFTLAHVPVSVPSLLDQRLILLLHAARSGSLEHPDKVRSWTRASSDTRAEIRARADECGATVALAAAIGELDLYRDDPAYQLWDQFSRNPDHTRTEEWVARVKAARNPLHAASVAVRALAVNTDRLGMDLGHDPSGGDVRREYGRRAKKAWRELRDRMGGGQ